MPVPPRGGARVERLLRGDSLAETPPTPASASSLALGRLQRVRTGARTTSPRPRAGPSPHCSRGLLGVLQRAGRHRHRQPVVRQFDVLPGDVAGAPGEPTEHGGQQPGPWYVGGGVAQPYRDPSPAGDDADYAQSVRFSVRSLALQSHVVHLAEWCTRGVDDGTADQVADTHRQAPGMRPMKCSESQASKSAGGMSAWGTVKVTVAPT